MAELLTSCFVGQGLAEFIQKSYSLEALNAVVQDVWREKHDDG